MVRLLCVTMMNCDSPENLLMMLLKLVNVGIIQWGIYLIKDTEGGRLEQVNGKEEGSGGQRFLST